MKLSEQATTELKEILRKNLGEATLAEFSDETLNDLGVRLLKITATILKIKNYEKYEITQK